MANLIWNPENRTRASKAIPRLAGLGAGGCGVGDRCALNYLMNAEWFI